MNIDWAELVKLADETFLSAPAWPGLQPFVPPEYEAEGFQDTPGRYVCRNCIAEDALRDAMFEHLDMDEYGSYTTGNCSYSQTADIPTVAVDALFGYIDRCLAVEYASAEEEWIPVEDKYGESIAGNSSATQLLGELDDELFNSEKLTEAFIEAFDGRHWAKRDAMEEWENVSLKDGWKRFAHHVTHVQRYAFFDPSNSVGMYHPDDRDCPHFG